MTEFRYSATVEQIALVASMSADMAEAWSRELEQTHSAEVGYYSRPCEVGIDVSRIARELGIELCTEPVIGQAYVLAPMEYGGIALWRQRIGTTYRPRQRQQLFKSERLA